LAAGRKLDSMLVGRRFAVGDRHHQYDLVAIAIGAGEDDRTGTILPSFFRAGAMLVAPEISI
jgi:hypothetical protein